MIIHTKTVQQWDDNLGWVTVEDHAYDYEGEVALADRSAQGQAQGLANTAAGTAGTEKSTANSLQGSLIPFYSQEMNTQHGFAPQQMSELMTYAEGGAGAAAGAGKEQANLEAARSGNTASTSAVLDEVSRGQEKADAGSSEGVAAADVMGAQQKNQQGAAGMSNLYGVDTSAMLSSMGLQNSAIGQEVNAGDSGWFQNMTGLISALGKGGQGAGAAMSGYAAMQ